MRESKKNPKGSENINNQGNVMPGFENMNNQGNAMPGFDNMNNQGNVMPGFDNMNNQGNVMPGFDNMNNQGNVMPGLDNMNNQGNVMPGFDNMNNQGNVMPGFDNINNQENVKSNSAGADNGSENTKIDNVESKNGGQQRVSNETTKSEPLPRMQDFSKDNIQNQGQSVYADQEFSNSSEDAKQSYNSPYNQNYSDATSYQNNQNYNVNQNVQHPYNLYKNTNPEMQYQNNAYGDMMNPETQYQGNQYGEMNQGTQYQNNAYGNMMNPETQYQGNQYGEMNQGMQYQNNVYGGTNTNEQYATVNQNVQGMNQNFENLNMDQGNGNSNSGDYNMQFVKAWMGKIYEKAHSKKFNIFAALFNGAYLYYRKMYTAGTIILALQLIITIAFLLTKSTIIAIADLVFYFVLFLLMGFGFYPLYRSFVKGKLNKYKGQTQDNNQLVGIANQKGGTSIGGLIIYIIILAVTSAVLGTEELNQLKPKNNNVNNTTDNSQEEQTAVVSEFNIGNEYDFEYNPTTWLYDQDTGELIKGTYTLKYSTEYSESKLGVDFSSETQRATILEQLVTSFTNQAASQNMQVESPNSTFIAKNYGYYAYVDVIGAADTSRYYFIIIPSEKLLFQFVLTASDTTIDSQTNLEVIDMLTKIKKITKTTKNTSTDSNVVDENTTIDENVTRDVNEISDENAISNRTQTVLSSNTVNTGTNTNTTTGSSNSTSNSNNTTSRTTVASNILGTN